ncbi:hypothetical protein GCM10007036_10290 [Alsobacter metallidurans]|uniref:Helix-turn-helix domain-containing protein n=1 Tax=Alsobacter metallidurans TaxID=340221 RepID=A0A917I4U9_9HYPH|nr:hypothetical protein GCM10007036_10290 [Alsobacter metallidurans]
MDEQQLLTLPEACTSLLRGLVKPATLRAAASRGELTLERLGRRDFVTPAAINEWRSRCRVSRSRPDSGFARREASDTPHGSSSMTLSSSPLDAARAIVKALKENSLRTSHASTGRKARAIRIAFR